MWRAGVGAAISRRGSLASQIATVSLSGSPGAGRIWWVCAGSRPASARNASTSRIGEAEVAVGVVLAQELVVVLDEVDDDQPAAGPQRARRLADRAGGIVEEMQHLVDDRQVIGVALDRRGVEVALPQLHVVQAALVDARAGQREHRRALVDADRAPGERRRQFEHPPGAGAKIEQGADRPGADHRHHRGLDPLLGGVQRANGVPVGGALREIGGGLAPAGLAGHRQAGAVGDQQRVVGIEAGDQVARQGAAGAARRTGVGEPEERPRAFALALGEAGFDQQLEVARHPRLRLAEDGDEFADRQLRLADQREQAQPGDLARRLEPAQQAFHPHPIPQVVQSLETRHIYMSISL